MTKHILVLIVLVAVLFGVIALRGPRSVVVPETVVATPSVVVSKVSYACAANKTIGAIYYKDKVDVKLSDGRTMTLPQGTSASSARYANADESFAFLTKGNGVMVLENNEEKIFIGCIRVAEGATAAGLNQVYIQQTGDFSIRLPEGYKADEKYVYPISSKKMINGVKFTIPDTMATGTNLSKDSYFAVETLSKVENCTASLFLDGNHKATEFIEGGALYSVASSSNAAAGSRYEEIVYAIPGTNPCMALRYFIHYTRVENYPEGTVKEFDQAALIAKFDKIRRSLVVNQ